MTGTPPPIGSEVQGESLCLSFLMGALVGGLCGRLVHVVSPDAASTRASYDCRDGSDVCRNYVRAIYSHHSSL